MKTLAQLAQLTDNNDHSTAMVEAAKIILARLKDNSPTKIEMETILFNLKSIRDRHHLLNQLVAEDYHERYELYKRMMEIIKDIDEDFYKKLYACL